MISDEIIKAIDEGFELLKKQHVDGSNGTKEKPYKVFVSETTYKIIKPYLDEDDMHFCEQGEAFGWNKFIVVGQNQVVADYYEPGNLADTSYSFNVGPKIVPNRETRRTELKKKTGNPHELNVGRISLSGTDMICSQKEKKKNFNEFIKERMK